MEKKNKRNRILALFILGGLAWWKYKKSTPEEKQKLKDSIKNPFKCCGMK